MSKGWRDDWDAMARKTVIRNLLGKHGLMSIEYQDGTDKNTMNLAAAVAGQDEDLDPDTIEGEGFVYTGEGGEIIDGETEELEYPDFLKEVTGNGND